MKLPNVMIVLGLLLAGGFPSTIQGQPQKVDRPHYTTNAADPLQKCARKAINGDFGTIPYWKLNAYQTALANGTTVQGAAWVTSYYPQEGFHRGKGTRSGIGVSERSAAIRSCDWRKYRGCYVWTAAYGMRIVEDTGSNHNHRVAVRKGADLWLDYWWPRPHNQNPITPFAFIRPV